MKESLIKNKVLKEMCIDNFFDHSNSLYNEFHLVYKLLKLTNIESDWSFSSMIYLLSDNINLKLNYLKCFIDEIDHLFFNFHYFDLLIIFL
jgi:hypothetical protein